jgi:hypothetical protein
MINNSYKMVYGATDGRQQLLAVYKQLGFFFKFADDNGSCMRIVVVG